MNDLRKVLVVDHGDRGFVDPLSAELSELGLSSVTTSIEAAQDVLRVIETPSAIILKMPDDRMDLACVKLRSLAEELRARPDTAHIPVVVWDRTSAFQAGSISAVLQSQYGAQIFATPTA